MLSRAVWFFLASCSAQHREYRLQLHFLRIVSQYLSLHVCGDINEALTFCCTERGLRFPCSNILKNEQLKPHLQVSCSPSAHCKKKIHYNQILCKHGEFCFTGLGESVFACNTKAFLHTQQGLILISELGKRVIKMFSKDKSPFPNSHKSPQSYFS